MTEKEFRSRIIPLHRQLYACAYAVTHDPDSASDCVQECMARLWENRRRLGESESPEGYAVVTVRRLAIDMRRKIGAAHEDPLDEVAGLADPGAGPHERAEARDRLRQLEATLAELPPRQREVVVMSGVGGLSNSEIEEATGLSGDNVRVMLSRGRKRLRQLLGMNK